MDGNVQFYGYGWRFLPMEPREFGVRKQACVPWVTERDIPQPYETFQDPIYFDPAKVEAMPPILNRIVGDQLHQWSRPPNLPKPYGWP
jgi:hypothetical protein